MLPSVFEKLAAIDPAAAGIFEVHITENNIQSIANAAFVAAGILAVFFIIIGGISYTLSAGDPSKISKAKDTILYAVIGLIVVLISFVAIQFVLGRFK